MDLKTNLLIYSFYVLCICEIIFDFKGTCKKPKKEAKTKTKFPLTK